MKRVIQPGILIFFILVSVSSAWAQKTARLSIATGSREGIYYILGDGMANILSKYIPSVEAKASVTPGSVSNCLFVEERKADLALVMGDTAWDAYQGKSKPFRKKIPLRTIAVFYPSPMQLVSMEGTGIEKVTDLRGKRVSTGAPGSGTEVMAMRVIRAYGLNPDRDMTREKLTLLESTNAMRDKKIDAFFWVGGLPTPAITDLAATPGWKIKLIGHEDVIPKMREKYGPIYLKGIIPAKTYPGQEQDVPIAVVWNLLACREDMKADRVYDIVKALFEHRPELEKVHREANQILLKSQSAGNSPIPYHPGAIRYFSEQGLKIQ